MINLHLFFFIGVFLFSNIRGLEDNKITILTAPIGYKANQSGGPSQVTRSLIQGLKTVGVPFNYNPTTDQEVGEKIIVLADVAALEQAIEFKKKGKIKKLFAGPNLVIRANDYNKIIAKQEIDVCIVPCEWVQIAYIEDEPSLKERIKVWYAGVDTNYWMPRESFQLKLKKNVQDVLIYCKTEDQAFYMQIELLLKLHNLNPIRMQYGIYDKEHFKEILSRVLFGVFISRSESQGIAMAEAWAMDVPTIVWDLQKPFTFNNKSFWPISSAPYLCTENGLFWKDIIEFNNILENFEKYQNQFSPRDWVLKNMSDEISAQLLLKIIHDV